jgi:hypothetical protein
VAGFELATEDEGGEGEFLFWEAERGAKEILEYIFRSKLTAFTSFDV